MRSVLLQREFRKAVQEQIASTAKEKVGDDMSVLRMQMQHSRTNLYWAAGILDTTVKYLLALASLCGLLGSGPFLLVWFAVAALVNIPLAAGLRRTGDIIERSLRPGALRVKKTGLHFLRSVAVRPRVRARTWRRPARSAESDGKGSDDDGGSDSGPSGDPPGLFLHVTDLPFFPFSAQKSNKFLYPWHRPGCWPMLCRHPLERGRAA